MESDPTFTEMAAVLHAARQECHRIFNNISVQENCSKQLVRLAVDICMASCAHFDPEWHFFVLEFCARPTGRKTGRFDQIRHSFLCKFYDKNSRHQFDVQKIQVAVRMVACAALSIASALLREHIGNPGRLVSRLISDDYRSVSKQQHYLETVQDLAIHMWLFHFDGQIDNVDSVYLELVRLTLQHVGTNGTDAANRIGEIEKEGMIERLQSPISTTLYKRYDCKKIALAVLCMYEPNLFMSLTQSSSKAKKAMLATMADVALVDGNPQSFRRFVHCIRLSLNEKQLVRCATQRQIKKHCGLWINRCAVDCRDFENGIEKWRSMRRLDNDICLSHQRVVCKESQNEEIDTICVRWSRKEMDRYLQMASEGKTMLGEGTFGQVHRMSVLSEQLSFVEQLARFCGGMELDPPKRFIEADEVAVKTFKGRLDFFRISDMFVESSLLMSLNHPNVTRAHKVLCIADSKDSLRNGTMAVCMPLYHTTLHHVIKKQMVKSPSPIFESVPIFAHHVATLYSALDFMHKSGYLHNDIKGHNILVQFENHSDRPKRLVLADFGSATCMFPLTQKECWMSEMTTICWRAPEKVLQNSHVLDSYRPYAISTACDLWSLAVVTIEMLLCERMLFGTKNQTEKELLSKQWKACGHLLAEKEQGDFFAIAPKSDAVRRKLKKHRFDLDIAYNPVSNALSAYPQTFVFIFENMLHLLPTMRASAETVAAHFRQLSFTEVS